MGAGGAIVSTNGQELQVGPTVDVIARITSTCLHVDRDTCSRQLTLSKSYI